MTQQVPVDDLYLEQLLCGSMQNFVYIVGSRRTRQVALVDPAWAIDALLHHVAERGYEPVAALVTHYHQDHVGGEIFGHRIEGLCELIARRGMKIYVNKHEADGLKQITGLAENDLKRVESGDRLRLGDVELEFLHTPGHTPGSQCFRVREALVAGDTLFIQGCGRVDLPGADPDQMYESLQKLKALPGDTILYPGHDYGGGPHLSLAETRRVNPYLRIPDLATWRRVMASD